MPFVPDVASVFVVCSEYKKVQCSSMHASLSIAACKFCFRPLHFRARVKAAATHSVPFEAQTAPTTAVCSIPPYTTSLLFLLAKLFAKRTHTCNTSFSIARTLVMYRRFVRSIFFNLYCLGTPQSRLCDGFTIGNSRCVAPEPARNINLS